LTKLAGAFLAAGREVGGPFNPRPFFFHEDDSSRLAAGAFNRAVNLCAAKTVAWLRDVAWAETSPRSKTGPARCFLGHLAAPS
jgi:hypothetical protein